MKFILVWALLQLLQSGALCQWTYILRNDGSYQTEYVQKGEEFHFTCKGDKNLTWISDKAFTVEYGREDDTYFSVMRSKVSPSRFCCHYMDAEPKPSSQECGSGTEVETFYIRKVTATAVREVKVHETINALVGSDTSLSCHVKLKNNAKQSASSEYNISTFWIKTKNEHGEEKRYPAIESNCWNYDYLVGSSVGECDRTWYTSELPLKNLSKEDAGSYACGIHSFGSDMPLNRSTNVRVWEPEEVAILVHSPQSVSRVTRGENASWRINVSSVLSLDSSYTCNRLVQSDKTLNCRAHPNGDLTSITFEVWIEQVNGSSGDFLLDFKNELLKNETKLELLVSDPRWTSLAIVLTVVIGALSIAFVICFIYSGLKILEQKRINKEMMAQLDIFKLRHEKHFPNTKLKEISPKDLDMEPPVDSAPSPPPPPPPPPAHISLEDVSVTVPLVKKEIGTGHFGAVVLAKWEGRSVAIKYLPKDNPRFSLPRLAEEALTLRELGECGCGYIIQFIGAHICPRGGWKDFYIVMEYCEHRDLKCFLQNHHGTFRKRLEERAPKQKFIPSCPETFSVYTLIDWAHQIATGMTIVIRQGFFHNDLAAKNILLAPDSEHGNKLKLADFGLANRGGQMLGLRSGRLPYILLKDGTKKCSENYAEASDVYCYGQLLWELFDLGAREPLHPTTVGAYTKKNLRYCPDSVWELITECVHSDPEYRPTFSHIVSILEEILEECTETLEPAEGKSGKEKSPLVAQVPTPSAAEINSDTRTTGSVSEEEEYETDSPFPRDVRLNMEPESGAVTRSSSYTSLNECMSELPSKAPNNQTCNEDPNYKKIAILERSDSYTDLPT